MIFNPFVLGASELLKQTGALFKMQRDLLKAATQVIPQMPLTSEMTVLRPDPIDKGAWQRNRLEPRPTKNGDARHQSELTYYTFIPSLTSTKTPAKYHGLVVMLHGCEQNASVFAQGSQMNRYAELYNFVVLYPEQSKSNNFLQCWRWYDPSERGAYAEAQTIHAMITKTLEEYQIEPRQVYLAGMSAGAGMATAIALHYPEIVAALALHSGPVFGQAYDLRTSFEVMTGIDIDDDDELIEHVKEHKQGIDKRIPALVLHGVKDRVVNINNAEGLTKQLLYLNGLKLDTKPTITQHNKGTAQAYTKKVYYDKDAKPIIERHDIKELDHAWGGGDPSLPFNTAQGPSSSETVLRFFYEQATGLSVSEETIKNATRPNVR